MAEKSEAKPKSEAATEDSEKESLHLPTPIFGAVIVALLAGVAYMNNLPAGAQALFEPHVVPPPADAKPNEVHVQFCQA